jgi:hypothetical protein
MRRGDARARRTAHRQGLGSRIQQALDSRRHRFAVPVVCGRACGPSLSLSSGMWLRVTRRKSGQRAVVSAVRAVQNMLCYVMLCYVGGRYLAHTLRRTSHRSDTVSGVEPTPPDTSAAFGIRPHYAQGRVTTRRDLPPSATARERISCTQSRALSLSPILWALTTTLPSHQHAPACFPQSTPPSTTRGPTDRQPRRRRRGASQLTVGLSSQATQQLCLSPQAPRGLSSNCCAGRVHC